MKGKISLETTSQKNYAEHRIKGERGYARQVRRRAETAAGGVCRQRMTEEADERKGVPAMESQMGCQNEEDDELFGEDFYCEEDELLSDVEDCI